MNFNENHIIAVELLALCTKPLKTRQKERQRRWNEEKDRREGTNQTVQDDKDGHLKYKPGDWLNSRCIKFLYYSLCFAVTLNKLADVSSGLLLLFRSGFLMIVATDDVLMAMTSAWNLT